ncbi:NAD(P)/FAD-dependent oxidoreductase [Streptomyces yaanensis]|uniref:NAD(P)/FAD-dependent oxidoreductase n=1 Tax=Streptomyces yaanensis TaxID=1142239 RepID=A0ABV7S7F6_9ACTN|nr:NAD(P)/FAD-dependent oxidoreductase [Streptomyces sp. CGMCC 4.7035]WNB99736.1 NAD(P)/FAD-dependent oxidoreductase [Streptomyces sp. CGMCC 4.7035]
MFDAIVVGARCAGAPTAMLLARAGYRVLLLDKAPTGTDTLSTHLIHQPGVAALARWGLLDAVRASGCPPLDHAVYEVADIRLEGCARGVEGQRASFAPRRHVLDAILVEAAAAAGVEVRDRCRVTGLLRDDSGRVIGVEGSHDGRSFTERAHLVIGADGMRSTVARLTQAPYTVEDPRLTCAYYTYWADVPATLELHERPGSWVAAVATHDAATLVLAYFPQSRFEAVRTDARRAYLEQIRTTAPALYERLRGREPVERLRGTGDQQNFFRQAAGPGWVLVGDAGHHKDSITARGISDAFLQVDALVRRLDGLLGGDPAELDAALREFAKERDAALTPGYESTLGVARLTTPHEQRLSLLRAVQTDSELTAIYFDMVAGIETAGALYTPKLLALL